MEETLPLTKVKAPFSRGHSQRGQCRLERTAPYVEVKAAFSGPAPFINAPFMEETAPFMEREAAVNGHMARPRNAQGKDEEKRAPCTSSTGQKPEYQQEDSCLRSGFSDRISKQVTSLHEARWTVLHTHQPLASSPRVLAASAMDDRSLHCMFSTHGRST